MAKSNFRRSVEAVAALYKMDEVVVAQVLLQLLASGWGNWRAL